METAQPTLSASVTAIPADVCAALRVADDLGVANQPFVDVAGGAGPLRCCLRRSEAGEEIMLVSYAPLLRWSEEHAADPGPYLEYGPVFLHAAPCAGPEAGFPGSLHRRPRVLRAYSRRGRILGGAVLDAGDADPAAAVAAAVAETFADEEVALIHVRALEFGCFLYAVERPAAVAG